MTEFDLNLHKRVCELGLPMPEEEEIKKIAALTEEDKLWELRWVVGRTLLETAHVMSKKDLEKCLKGKLKTKAIKKILQKVALHMIE